MEVRSPMHTFPPAPESQALFNHNEYTVTCVVYLYMVQCWVVPPPPLPPTYGTPPPCGVGGGGGAGGGSTSSDHNSSTT